MKLQAPPAYDMRAWQAILGVIGQALDGVFYKGQDVRLLRGERFSLKSSGGIETFLTVDDSGLIGQPAYLGASKTTTSAAASLTITAPGHYVFTGTTSTWTLPAISASRDWVLLIKNRGSGNLTVQRAGSDQIYDTSAVNSITVAAGAAVRMVNDGAFWDRE